MDVRQLADDPQLGGVAAGIGFAIPSDIVTSIAGQIITTWLRDTTQTALGVCRPVTEAGLMRIQNGWATELGHERRPR